MFVYTREAHPGEEVPHHDTFERKLHHARLMRDELGIRRRILVDDVDGTGHRAYGSLPNMTWVVGRGGRILYKASWTSAANVEAFLERNAAARAAKPAKGVLSPYTTEQVEWRTNDRDWFYDRLRRNGDHAYEDFRRAEQIWAERGDPT